MAMPMLPVAMQSHNTNTFICDDRQGGLAFNTCLL